MSTTDGRTSRRPRAFSVSRCLRRDLLFRGLHTADQEDPAAVRAILPGTLPALPGQVGAPVGGRT